MSVSWFDALTMTLDAFCVGFVGVTLSPSKGDAAWYDPIMSDLEKLVRTLVEQSRTDGIGQLAVGAAIVSDGKLLIMKRADHDDVFPSHFEIPGGSVDPGEDVLTAVKRETKEETGLDTLGLGNYCGSFDYTLGDGRLVRQFNFFLHPVTTDVRLDPNEHSVFHWWDPADTAYLDSIQITPLMRECVVGIGKQIA